MKWRFWIDGRKVALYPYQMKLGTKAKTEKNQILDIIYRKK